METEGTKSSWSHDPAQLNVPSPLAIPFLLANAHLNQPALNSAKIPLQKPDTQRCPFFNPTSSIHSPPFPSLCLCFIYRQWILNSLRTFFKYPRFSMLSNTLRHISNMEKDVADKTDSLRNKEYFFKPFFFPARSHICTFPLHCFLSLLKSKQTQRQQTALRNPKCFLHISLEHCPQRACGRYSEKQSLV